MNLPSILGLVAAGIAVAGAVISAARRMARMSASFNARVAALENALQTRALVVLKTDVLAEAPQMPLGVMELREGTVGTLIFVEGGRAQVRLEGHATVVSTALEVWRHEGT